MPRRGARTTDWETRPVCPDPASSDLRSSVPIQPEEEALLDVCAYRLRRPSRDYGDWVSMDDFLSPILRPPRDWYYAALAPLAEFWAACGLLDRKVIKLAATERKIGPWDTYYVQVGNRLTKVEPERKLWSVAYLYRSRGEMSSALRHAFRDGSASVIVPRLNRGELAEHFCLPLDLPEGSPFFNGPECDSQQLGSMIAYARVNFWLPTDEKERLLWPLARPRRRKSIPSRLQRIGRGEDSRFSAGNLHWFKDHADGGVAYLAYPPKGVIRLEACFADWIAEFILVAWTERQSRPTCWWPEFAPHEKKPRVRRGVGPPNTCVNAMKALRKALRELMGDLRGFSFNEKRGHARAPSVPITIHSFPTARPRLPRSPT